MCAATSWFDGVSWTSFATYIGSKQYSNHLVGESEYCCKDLESGLFIHITLYDMCLVLSLFESWVQKLSSLTNISASDRDLDIVGGLSSTSTSTES